MDNTQELELGCEEISSRIRSRMNSILRANLYDMNLSVKEKERLTGHKKLLRKHIRLCALGNRNSKDALISFIEDGISKIYKPDRNFWNKVWYFSSNNIKTVRYKFEVLLYIYEKKYGKDALDMLLQEEEVAESVAGEQKVSAVSIERIYGRTCEDLDDEEKLHILAVRIYENIWGLGSVDMLRDMRIDGLSGGVSGQNCVWIFYRGQTLALPFMEIKHDELERICRVLSRSCDNGQLSETRGYLVGDMADHARVVIARPPFSEEWIFFIRKFDSAENKQLSALLLDEGAKYPIEMLKFFMKGCQVTAVTGVQGSGKTTLLSAMIGHIPKEYTLRVLEMAFELHLRDSYPDRNIVTLRETAEIAGQEGLDLLKKTDGNVSIIGEVATAKVASWMIESGMVGTLFTLFTHHAKTVDALVAALRNCLLKEGSFSVEEIAEQQVVDVVRIDVHLHKDRSGHRYIERISEIVPHRDGNRCYSENILLRFEEGCYKIVNLPTDELVLDMKKWMDAEERREFDEQLSIWAMEKERTL